MPLPRYLPVRKKTKVTNPSLDDLDDYCLSKILGHALANSSSRDDGLNSGDNGRTEKNLSLVSKRWYFLTQSQVPTYGVHRINLDKMPRITPQTKLKSTIIPTSTTTTSTSTNNTIGRPNFYVGSVTKRPASVLSQRNFSASTTAINLQGSLQQPANLVGANPSYKIDLFRYLRTKLFKYKHIQVFGTLTCDEFRKLIVALDAARVERLDLKVKIEKDGTQSNDFSIFPKQLVHLDRLTLFWTNDSKFEYSNALTWTLFNRATRLRRVEVHLSDESNSLKADTISIEPSRGDSLRKIINKFSDIRQAHLREQSLNLTSFVFKRTGTSSPEAAPAADCSYAALMKEVLSNEKSINEVDTNDNMLMEHLISMSSRVSTQQELSSLKFLSPIKNLELLAQLFNSKLLGTRRLLIVIDQPEHLEGLRHLMESFKLTRSTNSSCQIGIHLKDQKFLDCEDKIKNLIHLCRAADVTVYISAQQRVSIDCCHLMWSTGRGLQASEVPGKCLFKIILQNQTTSSNGFISKQLGNNKGSEITIPFGRSLGHKINSSREDVNRFREIMKSVKKDCYHQFVKSVRENIQTT